VFEESIRYLRFTPTNLIILVLVPITDRRVNYIRVAIPQLIPDGEPKRYHAVSFVAPHVMALAVGVRISMQPVTPLDPRETALARDIIVLVTMLDGDSPEVLAARDRRQPLVGETGCVERLVAASPCHSIIPHRRRVGTLVVECRPRFSSLPGQVLVHSCG